MPSTNDYPVTVVIVLCFYRWRDICMQKVLANSMLHCIGLVFYARCARNTQIGCIGMIAFQCGNSIPRHLRFTASFITIGKRVAGSAK
jgi:hypothetical protein